MMQERVEHDYRVTAWWTSGRTGIAKSDSAPNAIHFTAPKNFGGLEGRWTPEELLLASITSVHERLSCVPETNPLSDAFRERKLADSYS